MRQHEKQDSLGPKYRFRKVRKEFYRTVLNKTRCFPASSASIPMNGRFAGRALVERLEFRHETFCRQVDRFDRDFHPREITERMRH